MAEIAGATKFFPIASETFANALSATIPANSTVVAVNSAVGFSDGDQVVLTVEPGTPNQATFTGTKNGDQFSNCIWTEGNLGVGHNQGVPIVDYMSATHFSLYATGALVAHNPDGTQRANSVGAAAIQSGAIGSNHYATGSIPASAIPAGLINSAMIANGAILLADLSPTLFGDAVQTYSPTVSSVSGCSTPVAYGSYVNLLGIKLCWGSISVASTATTNHVQGVTLPPGFFTGGVKLLPAIQGVNAAAYQQLTGDSLDASGVTSFSFYIGNTSNGAGALVTWIAIGQ